MSENWVFFIDTNIFLDFYRLNGESAERQLNALEKHADRLITGDQVRMEFLNNRQKVIAKTLKDLKAPSQDGVPQILTGLQDAQLLIKNQKEAKSRFQKIKRKAELILSDPTHHDQVYKSFNRIFDAKTPLNLCRPMKERISIRNLARKRFILGYPPRKPSDTSIGDSINWEWIIACAQRLDANTHVMIVSRDSDYGCQLENEYFLNDWLKREFKDRVSRKRKIVLTGKLTDALKRMSETVTLEDEKEETQLIKQTSSTSLSELFRTSNEIHQGVDRSPAVDRNISGFLAQWIRESIAKTLEEKAAEKDE